MLQPRQVGLGWGTVGLGMGMDGGHGSYAWTLSPSPPPTLTKSGCCGGSGGGGGARGCGGGPPVGGVGVCGGIKAGEEGTGEGWILVPVRVHHRACARCKSKRRMRGRSTHRMGETACVYEDG